jgi:HPt (histidine-containing phosphotransfer) domain-containing protein
MENQNECTDLSYLSSLSSGSTEFMQQMISVFMEQTPKALDQIKTHYAAQDWKQLGAIAHKIKPSFAFMGIRELEPVIAELEDNSVKQVNLESIPEKIKKIEEVCNVAMKELEQKSKQLA